MGLVVVFVVFEVGFMGVEVDVVGVLVVKLVVVFVAVVVAAEVGFMEVVLQPMSNDL